MKLLDRIRKYSMLTCRYASYIPVCWKKRFTWEIGGSAKFEIRCWTSDRTAVWETWKKKMYNPRGFEINKGDIIVDIGGNIGAFSIYAAVKAKEGKVFAYEPSPENFKRLEKNIRLNRLTNVFPFMKAVDGKAGKNKLYLSKWNFGGHSLFDLPVMNEPESVDVECVTLKGIFVQNNLPKIDFLKIDCEGGEYGILLSTPPEYLRKIGKISMEYHKIPGHDISRLIELLEEVGFEVTTEENLISSFLETGLLRAVNKKL